MSGIKWFPVLRLVTVAFLVLAVTHPCFADKSSDKPFFKKQFLFGAHRAGAGQWPESTLFAYVEAAKRWPDVLLEMDVRLTADGQVVLLHNDTVDAITDGSGKIVEMTLEEARKLDAGYDFTPDGGQTYPYRGEGLTIATLKEILEALPDSHFLVETKPEDGIVDATVKVIKEAGAQDRVLMASFIPAHMDRVRELAPDIATCYDFANGQEMLTALRGEGWDAYEPKADVLSLMRRMVKQFSLTPEEIQSIRAKGVRVQVHTVDDPTEMAYYLDLGVDSILTDYPDRLELAIAQWKERNAARATE